MSGIGRVFQWETGQTTTNGWTLPEPAHSWATLRDNVQSEVDRLNAVYIPHQHTWQLEHEPVVAGSGKLVILPAFRELRAHF